MELKFETVLAIMLAFIYAMVAMMFTCGCSLHIGEAPCVAYVRTVEAKLAECGGATAKDRALLASMYDACEPGLLGLAFVDADKAEGCAEDVAAMTCEEFRAKPLACRVSTVTL